MKSKWSKSYTFFNAWRTYKIKKKHKEYANYTFAKSLKFSHLLTKKLKQHEN